MATKIRLGIFIFVTILISCVMLYSNEKSTIEKLSPTEGFVYQIGDSFAFQTSLTPNEIIERTGALVLDEQKLENEGLEIYYCFVENINNFIVSQGKKVNLQISFDGEISTVGFPLILTGY